MPAAAARAPALSPPARRLLAAVRSAGEAWVVPGQLAMVRRLQAVGLVRLEPLCRYDPLRGSKVRRVVAGLQLEAPSSGAEGQGR